MTSFIISSMHPDGGSPRTLLIGNTTSDLTPHGPELGGAVAYAGLTLAALGCQVRVLTSAAGSHDLSPLEGQLDIQRVPSPTSTTFENLYESGSRVQYLRARGGSIGAKDLPPGWGQADLLMLAPVLSEVEPTIALGVEHTLLGISAQGWFRETNLDGPVRLKPWWQVLPRIPGEAIVTISEEDLGGSDEGASELADRCRVLALTKASNGADVFYGGRRLHVPAPARAEIDPTGAGDIFAAVFFLRLLLGDQPPAAAERANRYAADSVGRSGLAAAPGRLAPVQNGALQG